MNKIERFHALHAGGCFVIPNPWDLGSARLLEQLGFKAVATTSSGLAWSNGKQDNHLSVDVVLAHCRAVAAAIEIPVNADFENGFADEPEAVAANVARAVETGIAGLSIEDSTGNSEQPLYDFEFALERVKAARRAIDESCTRVVFTARSEGMLFEGSKLSDTIERLVAYADAGADCLFAPGLRKIEDMRAVVNAVEPKPVNVLVAGPYANLRELEDIGVRRISTGGALARAAWRGFIDAAQEIAEHGTFEKLGAAIPGREFDARFA